MHFLRCWPIQSRWRDSLHSLRSWDLCNNGWCFLFRSLRGMHLCGGHGILPLSRLCVRVRRMSAGLFL